MGLLEQYVSERDLPNGKFSNLKIGALVLLKEENLLLSRWTLERIVKMHCGKDNIVRVASVRTSTGLHRRALSKICYPANGKLD